MSVALLALALPGFGLLADTLTVDGSCTLGDAIGAANIDSSTGACTHDGLPGGDGDDLCADVDCNDGDPTNACHIFSDGFESGSTSAWSSVVP